MSQSYEIHFRCNLGDAGWFEVHGTDLYPDEARKIIGIISEWPTLAALGKETPPDEGGRLVGGTPTNVEHNGPGYEPEVQTEAEGGAVDTSMEAGPHIESTSRRRCTDVYPVKP